MIKQFWTHFKRSPTFGSLTIGPDGATGIAIADTRSLTARLRHGLIAALVGDRTVVANASITLARPVVAPAGSMFFGNIFGTTE